MIHVCVQTFSERTSTHTETGHASTRRHTQRHTYLELGAVLHGAHVPDEVVGHVQRREVGQVLQLLVSSVCVVV